MTVAVQPGVANSADATRPRRITPGFSENLAWQLSSRANWLWMVPVPSWDHAVELSPIGSRLPGALDEHFEHVDHLPLDPSAAAALPFADASVACVALHDAGASLASPSAAALLAECSRILMPGGWLYIGMTNDASFSRVRMSPLRWAARFALEAVVPSAVRRVFASSIDAAVRRAGFGQMRRYFAWPSEASQRMLIPAERSAAVAHERLDRIASHRRRLRMTLASFGLYSGLYPVRIFLCRR
jgi:SAM-dependent methyltransferase